jgi:carbamoyltransferase
MRAGGWAVSLVKDLLAAKLHFPGRRVKRAAEMGFDRKRMQFVEHHLCHAAAAYYGLRQHASKKYLVLTLDGAGDELCGTVSLAENGRLRRLHQTRQANSLGGLYSIVTFLLGFEPMEHEYKLMGMAPYVEANAAERASVVFQKYLDVDEERCDFRRGIAEPIAQCAPRLRRDLAGMRFDHICAGLQLFTEQLMARWVRAAIRKYRVHALLCGGGVFMNVKANKMLSEMPEVDEISVFPSCGDETNPIGACYVAAGDAYGWDDLQPITTMYLGADIADAEAEAELARRGVAYRPVSDIEAEVARLLAEGETVARVKGRMELGARALGNRSILADPANLENVRILNLAVKKRDFWMPFAPVMREETHLRYLRNPKKLASPHMMMAFETRENFRDLIAAVHNADLSARAQILRYGDNPALERLLVEFERRTRRGVLLNTSYNLHGYPICRGAKESIDVFLESGLKYLALNDFLVTK